MYSIYAGGVCIYSGAFALDSMKVISPKLTLEDNGAGSLTMTLPPQNIAYNTIVRMVTDISVEKDGEEIWAGRVLSESEDFYRNRVLCCEGELAYFNDSTQPPAEYSGLTVRGYLERLIAVHNSKAAANRQFAIGAVTVVDDSFPTYYTNYENTMSIINALVERYGGHIRVRKVDGVRYVDYLKEYPDTCSQAIQFGVNLIAFTKRWDAAEFATVIVPLGRRLENSPIEALDAYLTVENVNQGSMYVQSSEAVAVYGWIEKTVTWDDVSDPAVLLEKAKAYLADVQFNNMELELSALDLHYLYADVEAVKLLDEIRVISRPHGLDRLFPVTRLEIPLDSPEQTQFKLGDSVKKSLTSANNQMSAAILQKIEGLPKAHSILKEAKENATHIMNMATTGYITITKDQYGSDTLYISNVRDYTKASKLWKWNMNGLGYSNDGGKTFGLAITMDGSIVADYITTGVLNADVIRAGTLRDYSGNFILDMATGKLTIKKGSIDIGNGNFTVDEEGNLYARRGTFAGTLAGAKGTFGGQLVAASGDFKGVVQASDFLDRAGNSMMTGSKFSSGYLDLYGLAVTNKNTGEITFAVSSTGVVTINGRVTMGAGSTINWAAVDNKNLAYNPAYSLASDACDTADAAYTKANRAYELANSVELPSYIQSTYIDATTIKSPVIEGGEFYGGRFNVIAGRSNGSFNLYGSYGDSRYHMFTIEYFESTAPYINIYSPCGGFITIGSRKGVVYFSGTVDFSGATVRGLSIGGATGGGQEDKS
ncbi:hypothetical protein D1159_05555 [Pseudoflavonifractor sp. 524-17]|uniref:phage tail protein n=1 Tax=Pseudoflavonifractor sp. 524-17 TaxID=2304577 RepID=UPI00137A25C0|nr:hypothetical protein [Pseudoflavonifractor sp. 524-17]